MTGWRFHFESSVHLSRRRPSGAGLRLWGFLTCARRSDSGEPRSNFGDAPSNSGEAHFRSGARGSNACHLRSRSRHFRSSSGHFRSKSRHFHSRLSHARFRRDARDSKSGHSHSKSGHPRSSSRHFDSRSCDARFRECHRQFQACRRRPRRCARDANSGKAAPKRGHVPVAGEIQVQTERRRVLRPAPKGSPPCGHVLAPVECVPGAAHNTPTLVIMCAPPGEYDVRGSNSRSTLSARVCAWRCF